MDDLIPEWCLHPSAGADDRNLEKKDFSSIQMVVQYARSVSRSCSVFPYSGELTDKLTF
jgi:hypothetical protein